MIQLTMNLKEGIFTLNNDTLEALGRPRQVQLLINLDKKMLVLRSCKTDDAQAVVLPDKPVLSTDISGRSLLKKISASMKWEDSRMRICYGNYLPQHKAVCFNLTTAE